MSSAFRDDLEAARSRADALAEQNEELREEVERLRAIEAKHDEPHTDTHGAAADPELVKLAESTLEKLEHLTEDADRAPPPAPAPEPREPTHHAELTETATIRLAGTPAARPLTVPLPYAAQVTEYADADVVVARLRDKLQEELATAERRARRRFWLGLAVGIALGFLLAHLFR